MKSQRRPLNTTTEACFAIQCPRGVAGTFTIDATAKPKNLEFIPGQDIDKGKTCHGIYELDGDTYKVCFAPPGKERPKEFAAKPGSGYTLHIWKREKK